MNLHTILADPASDTSALAAWVDEAQWLDRSSNHILADRLPDTSALGSAIDEARLLHLKKQLNEIRAVLKHA